MAVKEKTVNKKASSKRVDFSPSAWSRADSNALNTKIKLHMWFDVSPPNENSSFHRKAAKVLEQLSQNHDVIRRASLRDNSKIYIDEYVAQLISNSIAANRIPKTFFYAAESAQLFSLAKMTLNYCLLSGDCASEGSEQNIADKLTAYTYSQTKKGRSRRQYDLQVNLDELGMIAVVGGALAATVLGVSEMINNADYSSDKFTGTNEDRWCKANDVCFTVLDQDIQKKKITIQCTKGPYIGQKHKICGNSKGKWADGCGFSDTFAFHENSSTKAGNNACGFDNWLLN